MSTHVRSPEHSQGSVIEVLGSPDHVCGTVCPSNCDSKTFASPSLGGYLRHFCTQRLGALWLLCFNGAGYKHSYLLTYSVIPFDKWPPIAMRWSSTKKSGLEKPSFSWKKFLGFLRCFSMQRRSDKKLRPRKNILYTVLSHVVFCWL